MATFPGSPPNPLGFKAELNLNSVWTDITQYVMLRDAVQITNMGRTDESGNITPSQLTLTLKNDGRFTPKNSSGAYYPNIVRNCQIRISVNATSKTTTPQVLNLNTGFETDVLNWTAESNATIARSTSQAHTGAASMSLHGNGTTAGPQAESEKEPVSPNSSYSATAWFFNTATWGSGVLVQINWYDAGNSFISSNNNSIGSLPANTWTQVSVTATAPSNAAYGTITARASGTPASGNIFFIDDAALTAPGGVPYSGFRFFGEISSWPPGYDISQRDSYVSITASGIWRRISQASVPIGSCYWRYANLLTGLSVPAAYWSMEDGSSGTSNPGFVLSEGTGTNIVPTGTPSYAADGSSFPGSNAIPAMNGARLAANVSSAATPTNNVMRFALSVPPANDSSFSQFTLNTVATMISSAATVKRVDVTLNNSGQLSVVGYTSTAGGTAAFGPSTITTKVAGVPVLVSVEITPSGGSIAWAMKIIKPGAGSVLDSVSGTRASSTITAVTQIQLNNQGRLQDTALGQLGIWYTVPSLTTAASNIGGQAGELAGDRITRLCAESNIPLMMIGSGGAALGPQVSDTMANVLQSIEDTDGGLLFETTSQFGLGYRTLASMQNQAAQVIISYSAGVLGAPLTPTYDDQLIHNQWTVQNTPTGYSVTAQLNSGALSVSPPPNGVGQGYAASKSINANANSQADAIATQLLKQGTVDDVRYPVVVISFLRTAAAPFFSSVPSLRIGDYFQVTNLPAFLGGGTTRQLAWGYSERIGGDPEDWTISFNAIPELPFETGFSPGSFTVLQGAAGGVPQGSSVGSTVNGSQVGPGAIGGGQAAVTLSARSIGGITQFISAATPYKWAFAVTGTPADNSYFTCTTVQSLPVAVGDTFSNTGGLGSPFTVTSTEQAGSGLVNVHFTPDATGVMSSGTVQGGTNGDTWVNTSAGNQLNQWNAGAWNAIQWNAANVITANTITASQIAAGIVIAGIVNGTVIQGATVIADGTSGEILVYSGTPALGNLIGSWSGANGTDAQGNAFHTGLEVEIGGLVLDNQASAPSGTSGASTFYSSVLGRPRYISSVGDDSVLERSIVSQTNVTMTTQTAATAMSQQLDIQSGEANVGSEFDIEIIGTITAPTGGSGFSNGAAGVAYTMQLMIDGSVIGGAFTLGGVFLVQGSTFSFNAAFRLSVEATGAGGTCTMSSYGTCTEQGINIGNLNAGGVGRSQPMSSVGTGKAIDTTTSHAIKVFGFWGSTLLTGHSAKTVRSKMARRM